MRIYSPYADDGHWFKGNVHCHSTGSDGALSPGEVIEYYRNRGYDFVSVTDHGILTDTSAFSTADFLCIPGMELSHPHMVALGIREPIADRLDFAGQIEAINDAEGLAILAHPAWMGLRVEDIYAHEGMCGIEAYNYICHRLNGKGYSLNIWDELLARDKRLWGLAVDDSHFTPPHLGGAAGWICVRAQRLDHDSIMAAIRDGNFYSSRGPAIHSIIVEGNTIRVECSPARHIHFVGESWHGGAVHADDDGPLLTEAEFRPDPHSKYIRIEVLNAERRRAWTNPIWIEFE